MRVRLLCLFMLLAPLSGTAGTSAPRQASEKWVVNFDHAQCVASRNYGTKENPLFLALKAPALGDVMQVSVVRPGKASRFARQIQGKIIADDHPPLDKEMLTFGVAEVKQRVVRLNLPLAEFDLLRTADTLSIVAGDEINESFALTQVPSLMKVMDECVLDLRQVWHVSETQDLHPRLKQNSTGDLARLIRGDDYPEVAIMDMEQGDVRVAILVDEVGKIVDCTVVKTSAVAVLDAQTCAIFTKRARFKPAIGLDGKPAKSSHVQQVRWRLY